MARDRKIAMGRKFHSRIHKEGSLANPPKSNGIFLTRNYSPKELSSFKIDLLSTGVIPKVISSIMIGF